MVQRVSDREQRSTMAHSKRTRSSSPSNSGPSKRSKSTRTKISSDAKAPTGFFQRILKSFTSQSQDPQPTTEDESSYSSTNETANTRNKTPKSTSKQRELDSLESQHNSHARAVTPYSDQSSESEAKPKTSHTKSAAYDTQLQQLLASPKRTKRVVRTRMIVNDEDGNTSASQSEDPPKKLGRPPKRKIGRPRKVQTSESDEPEEPKKRVGRPPKSQTSESDEPEKHKKRVGRPSKSQTSESDEPETHKKRVGRPPKSQTSESDELEKPKKRVGRPPKSQTSEPDEPERPKKRVGRPPKIRAPESDEPETLKKRLGRPPKHRTPESDEPETPKKRLGRPPKHRTPESDEPETPKKRLGRPPKHRTPESDEPETPKKRLGRPPKHRTPESDELETPKKRMGRPRKHPQKSPGSAAPIGRPRVYPIKEPGPKRPLGRPRKVIQASVPEVNRPRGRPRLSKTSTTEEYTTESSEDEYSHADTNEEDDDERLARVMTKSPYLRNEEDFILSDTDSSDEIDPETKKMALADAREDSPFEEKLMYDTRTKTYYVKDVAEKRHNIGGLGFKETVSMPTIKSGKKHSSRDTEGYPSILLENETSGPFPIFDSNYRLTHILRGPSKILFPNRDGTKDTDIWAVEFEPGIDKVSSNIAAVCGGDTVELIDAGLGRVIKRYSHVENKEEFYCLAWTTLACMDAWAQEKPYNILAAAGVLGTIKLFNPTQSECYRYLFGHSKEISRLVFSKTKPRWLLSASGDMTVRLWDIGSPESKLDTSICLARFNLKNAEIPTALCMSNDMKWLFIGCDTGKMYRYSLGALTINRLRSAKMAAMIKFKPGHKRRGQGMVQFGSPMAEYPVSQEWHESYVDDILMIEKLGNDRTIFQCVISRASSDEEFIMWNPVKSTRKDADILTSYEWPESPASCLRMKLYEAAGEKAVVSGDCFGNIQVYDVGNGARSKDLSDGSKERLPPKRTFSHSQSTSVIRDVSFSHDMEYLISVDALNRVYIWRATTNI